MDKPLQPTTVAEVASAAAEAVDGARDQYDDVLVTIRRNPRPSVGIAAGAGFIAALLFRP